MNRCSQEIHLLILRIFAAIIPQLKQWVFSPQEIILAYIAIGAEFEIQIRIKR